MTAPPLCVDTDRPIDQPGAGRNTGHGHVYPRPDGVRNRCGGRALCSKCRADAARKAADEAPAAGVAAEQARRAAEVDRG